jgi:hypothetical protein
MNSRDLPLYYILVGLLYWAINIFVRKLHRKNEEGEGWFLSPFWLFGWPLCFLILISIWIERVVIKVRKPVFDKF